jgi:hypothetical protein
MTAAAAPWAENAEGITGSLSVVVVRKGGAPSPWKPRLRRFAGVKGFRSKESERFFHVKHPAQHGGNEKMFQIVLSGDRRAMMLRVAAGMQAAPVALDASKPEWKICSWWGRFRHS